MPADLSLSREEIERIRNGHAATGVWTADDAAALLQHALSEPTRLAAARAEGYREGVEAAARWHDYQATDLERRVEMREGQFISGMDRVARVHRCDAAAIRALSPPPAEPAQPNDGPGVWGRTAARQSQRITALEAENAALREVVAAVAKHVEGMDLGGSEHDHVCYRVDLRTDLLRRARALLQGQGGGDA